ncbi:MAG TPA: STAS domain-containing protein [Ilumatobacteraceae bacterium]
MGEVDEVLDVELRAIDSDRMLLVVRGEIDLMTATSFRAAVESALSDTPSRLVLDLADVGFIDSSGLAVLIEASRRTTVALRHPSASTERVLEASGLTELFEADDP